MSKKLEKLKEVNSTLKELLIKLETHVFLENINTDNLKNRVPEHVGEINRESKLFI
jgi:hypothetical protein